MNKKDSVSISWDWKEEADFIELEKKLKEIGIFVYEDPRLEGADQIGYIFSKRELSKDELENYTDD